MREKRSYISRSNARVVYSLLCSASDAAHTARGHELRLRIYELPTLSPSAAVFGGFFVLLACNKMLVLPYVNGNRKKQRRFDSIVIYCQTFGNVIVLLTTYSLIFELSKNK